MITYSSTVMVSHGPVSIERALDVGQSHTTAFLIVRINGAATLTLALDRAAWNALDYIPLASGMTPVPPKEASNE